CSVSLGGSPSMLFTNTGSTNQPATTTSFLIKCFESRQSECHLPSNLSNMNSGASVLKQSKNTSLGLMVAGAENNPHRYPFNAPSGTTCIFAESNPTELNSCGLGIHSLAPPQMKYTSGFDGSFTNETSWIALGTAFAPACGVQYTKPC